MHHSTTISRHFQTKSEATAAVFNQQEKKTTRTIHRMEAARDEMQCSRMAADNGCDDKNRRNDKNKIVFVLHIV